MQRKTLQFGIRRERDFNFIISSPRKFLTHSFPFHSRFLFSLHLFFFARTSKRECSRETWKYFSSLLAEGKKKKQAELQHISENSIMHGNEVLKPPRFISISISCVTFFFCRNAMSAFSIKEQFLPSFQSFSCSQLSPCHSSANTIFFVISPLSCFGEELSSKSPRSTLIIRIIVSLGGVHMSRLRQFFKTPRVCVESGMK